MRYVIYALALSVLVVSCYIPREDCKNSHDVAVMHASAQFTEVEQAHIQFAAARWQVFAGHEVVAVEAGSQSSTCTISRGPLTPPRIGEFRHETGDIVIDPNYSCDGNHTTNYMPCFEALVMHEMGHLLGLGHLPEGQEGIMRAAAGALDFTASDRAECVAAGVCLGAK